MGYNVAAVIHFWPKILILQYTWPDDPDLAVSRKAISRNTITKDGTITGDPNLLIDESSGRVVISGNSHSKQHIWEPF